MKRNTHREEKATWRHRHTEGRWPCTQRQRDWKGAPERTNKAGEQQETRRGRGGFSPTGSKEIPQPLDTPISDFRPQNCGTVQF